MFDLIPVVHSKKVAQVLSHGTEADKTVNTVIENSTYSTFGSPVIYRNEKIGGFRIFGKRTVQRLYVKTKWINEFQL